MNRETFEDVYRHRWQKLARAEGHRPHGRQTVPANIDGYEVDAKIVDHILRHPQSTAGDIAAALMLSTPWVNTRLVSMTRDGKLTRTKPDRCNAFEYDVAE